VIRIRIDPLPGTLERYDLSNADKKAASLQNQLIRWYEHFAHPLIQYEVLRAAANLMNEMFQKVPGVNPKIHNSDTWYSAIVNTLTDDQNAHKETLSFL